MGKNGRLLDNLGVIIAILSFLTSLTAIYLVVYPPVFKPNIMLATNFNNNSIPVIDSNKVDFLLYIYNGGNGPCVNMNINYDDRWLLLSLRSPKIFYQYTDVKKQVNLEYNTTGFFCSGGKCPFFVLPPNEVMIVDFDVRTWGENPNTFTVPPEKLNITVSCINQKITIDIHPKLNRKDDVLVVQL